jgi:ribosomal-protein-alanine N-acetyltransferase
MIFDTNNYTYKILNSDYTIDLLRFIENNRVFHKTSMPIKKDDFFTFNNCENILFEEMKLNNEGVFFRFYIFEKQGENIIGDVSLYDIKYGNISSAFVGIKIDKDFVRMGIGSDAMNFIISFARDELSLHSLRATILSENEPSKNLFLKFGFKYDGTISDLFLSEKGWKSHNLYSLIL